MSKEEVGELALVHLDRSVSEGRSRLRLGEAARAHGRVREDYGGHVRVVRLFGGGQGKGTWGGGFGEE